ncbi:MAG: tripartite tricarboxylate transporter substrate binding protein [Betaproteobacteria bacterium]|nr:tripartite tricarboxylate transporter substrate binding protein [Betaproteobacteria bacterium]
MKKSIQGLVATICALVCALTVGNALAQGRYPDKPVKVLVGYAPGGWPDALARVIGVKLAEIWGQPVVVENRPGANGVLAADQVAKAAPDGYTLLLADATTMAVNPLIYLKLPYSAKDLLPAVLAATAPMFLAVHKSLPVNSLQELIAMAKAQPGKLNYGSSGIGSPHHLSMEYFKSALGLDIVHVPFKGTGQSVPALVGGQIPMVFAAYPSLASHVKAGTVKLIASNAIKRAAFAPEVPTIAELAIPNYNFAVSGGYFAPAGTPREVVNKIAADISRVVRMPDVMEKFTGLGTESAGGSPEDYAALLTGDMERYARAVKSAGMKPE